MAGSIGRSRREWRTARLTGARTWMEKREGMYREEAEKVNRRKYQKRLEERGRLERGGG